MRGSILTKKGLEMGVGVSNGTISSFQFFYTFRLALQKFLISQKFPPSPHLGYIVPMYGFEGKIAFNKNIPNCLYSQTHFFSFFFLNKRHHQLSQPNNILTQTPPNLPTATQT